MLTGSRYLGLPPAPGAGYGVRVSSLHAHKSEGRPLPRLQYPRVLLPLENQFCGQQGRCLILGHLRAVHNVFNELRPERQCQILAVNIAGRLAVDDQQVIPAWPSGVNQSTRKYPRPP